MHKLIYNSIAVSLGLPLLQLLVRRARFFKYIPLWIRNPRVRDYALHAALLAMLIAALAMVGIGANNALSPSGSHDFMWTPAHDLSSGTNPYQSFMEWKAAGNLHTPPHFLNQSPSYPASVIVLFTPLAALDWPVAKITWLIANLVFIGLLLWGLQKSFPIKNTALLTFVVLLFLCSTPLRASLGAGQHNFLSLAAFIWAYHFSNTESGSPTLTGLLLSIAWVKYSLTFPLTLLFLARGRWKPVAVAAVIHALLTAAASWKMGLWPHEFFFSSVEVVLMGDGVGFLNMVAVAMNLKLPLTAALVAIAIASIYALWLLPRHNQSDDLILLTFLGLFSCAVFYHHGYDFIILILCTWAIARNSLTGSQAVASGLLVLLAWCGQWVAHELSPYLGPVGYHLTSTIDYLLIGIFYCTLATLWNCLRSRQVAMPAEPSQVGVLF